MGGYRLSAATGVDVSRAHSALNGASVRRLESRHAELNAKRVVDIVIGLGFGLVALPAMAVIWAVIRLDSPGPAIFRAKRIGRRGEPFSMYKFRTMVHGAEERLHEVAHLNVANGMIKIPDDPRVTRIGKWLRRFSLDELPQIYNIVAGHMSLVGPRPHDVDDLPHGGLERDPRLAMRPGLTGLWQICARSDPSLETRVRWDLDYINRWSLLLDALIVVKTVPEIVLATGGLVAAASKSAEASGMPADRRHETHSTMLASSTVMPDSSNSRLTPQMEMQASVAGVATGD